MTVAANWKSLALALEFDGYDLERIELKSYFQPEDACRCVLSEWLDGKEDTRQPANWATLIAALQESNYTNFAKDLEEALSTV